jgi:hypothetical protein
MVSFGGLNIKVVDAVSKWFRRPLCENDDIEPTVYAQYHVTMYPCLSNASVSLNSGTNQERKKAQTSKKRRINLEWKKCNYS